MKNIIDRWIRNRMLYGLVCAFAALLLLSFVISLFFYRQQAERFVSERHALMQSAVSPESGTAAQDDDAMIRDYVGDTIFHYAVALLICGSMAIYIFAARIYRPVKSVLDALPESARPSNNASEHDRIRGAVLELTGRLAAGEEFIRAQNLLLAQNYLRRAVLYGISDTDEADAQSERGAPASAFGCFSVFYLIPAGQFPSFDSLPDSIDIPPHLSGISLRRVSNRENGLILLASASEEGDGFQTAADGLLRHFDDGGISFCLVRSGIHRNAAEAHTAYLEASVAAEALAASPAAEPGAYYYLDIQAKQPEYALCASLSSLEQQLHQALSTGDADIAERLFSQYIACLSSSAYSERLRRVQIAAMLSRLLAHPAAAQQVQFHAAEAELMALSSPGLPREDFETRLKNLYRQIFAPGQTRNAPGSDRFESIQSYVHNHLYEETLSAAEVAEHFGISLPSLSREFQKHTGFGFLHYIHTKRIAAAKIMLRQGGKSVKEIAQEAGYANSLSFTRAFRKYEGITPGAYRTTNQE